MKQLREVTGAGMMDCKKALAACENDVGKATEYLRKKGLASADKKSGRIASEGLIGSYIHDGRIGVLVEVNSETDFVARSKEFKELVANIGMQVAACPQVRSHSGAFRRIAWVQEGGVWVVCQVILVCRLIFSSVVLICECGDVHRCNT